MVVKQEDPEAERAWVHLVVSAVLGGPDRHGARGALLPAPPRRSLRRIGGRRASSWASSSSSRSSPGRSGGSSGQPIPETRALEALFVVLPLFTR